MTVQPHTVLVIYIRAEPDRIWRMITTRDDSRAFFHETDIEPRVGGRFRLLNDRGEAITEGAVLIHDPATSARLLERNL